MRRVWTAAIVTGLLGCRAEQPKPSAAEPTAVERKATPSEPEPAAAEAEPSESKPASPPEPTPPQIDELLVLDTISCMATSSQSLRDCVHDWQALLRTPSAPAWARCTLDPADVEAHAPKANELWRGSFVIEPLPELEDAHRCKVSSIDARLPAAEHQIEALTNGIVAGVATGAEVSKLDPPVDFEAGPVRAVVGTSTKRVRFLSVYLRDLGPLLAVPGRELMTRDELRAALDEAFAGEWPGTWVRGARHFAPQVEDAEQRHGFGYTPTLSTCPAGYPDTWPWSSCAFAVPVLGPEGRRYLIMAMTPVRSPDEHALTRRLLIERIVEDGLQATPEAIAYAKARRAER